jgi:hypothetical protein
MALPLAHDRPIPPPLVGSRDAVSFPSTPTSESIRRSIGCALIIHLIIQTIGLDPSGAVWTDEASNVSRPDPPGANQIDAEHPSRNRKVEGSNPSSGSKTAGRRLSSKTSAFGWIRRWQPDRLTWRRYTSGLGPLGGVVRPRRVVCFARLIHRRGRVVGGLLVRAACGGDLEPDLVAARRDRAWSRLTGKPWLPVPRAGSGLHLFIPLDRSQPRSVHCCWPGGHGNHPDRVMPAWSPGCSLAPRSRCSQLGPDVPNSVWSVRPAHSRT